MNEQWHENRELFRAEIFSDEKVPRQKKAFWRGFWLRGPDLNWRPSGYEMGEMDINTDFYEKTLLWNLLLIFSKKTKSIE